MMSLSDMDLLGGYLVKWVCCVMSGTLHASMTTRTWRPPHIGRITGRAVYYEVVHLPYGASEESGRTSKIGLDCPLHGENHFALTSLAGRDREKRSREFMAARSLNLSARLCV